MQTSSTGPACARRRNLKEKTQSWSALRLETAFMHLPNSFGGGKNVSKTLVWWHPNFPHFSTSVDQLNCLIWKNHPYLIDNPALHPAQTLVPGRSQLSHAKQLYFLRRSRTCASRSTWEAGIVTNETKLDPWLVMNHEWKSNISFDFPSSESNHEHREKNIMQQTSEKPSIVKLSVSRVASFSTRCCSCSSDNSSRRVM